MKITTETYILPAYWASALINGDYSGLEEDEYALLNTWLNAEQPGSCVDCGEPFFAHSNDAGTLAGDVAEFTFIQHDDRTLERDDTMGDSK